MRIVEAACWAHARRKFFDLARLNKAPIAIETVARIDALLAIERDIDGLPPADRRQVRRERSRPRVKALGVQLPARRIRSMPGDDTSVELQDLGLQGSQRCGLRPGNVHSADGWKNVLEPVVARYRERGLRRYFRADAAFANPEVYEFLETEDYKYAIRLPANRILQDRIGYLLKRPVGRPPHHVRRYYANFRYRAASWGTSRRVVAKVEWHPGELYPRVGFIVTNMSRPRDAGARRSWLRSGGLPYGIPAENVRTTEPRHELRSAWHVRCR
jgi:Transposase DDE domain group 1/Transposase IS66 family